MADHRNAGSGTPAGPGGPRRSGNPGDDHLRPQAYDAAVFAALAEEATVISRHSLRRMLGPGLTALQSMVDHGVLRTLGVDDGALLDSSGDCAGTGEVCTGCGLLAPAPDAHRSSDQATGRGLDCVGVDAPAVGAPTVDRTWRARPGPGGAEGHGGRRGEGAGARDGAVGLCRCPVASPAEEPVTVEPRRLFDLPGLGAPVSPAPDDIPWADAIPVDAELIPVARIARLLTLHAPGRVPGQLYDGGKLRLGMTVGAVLDISEYSAHRLIAQALTALLGLPRLVAQVRCGLIDFRKLALAADLAGDFPLLRLRRIDQQLAALRPSMRLADFRRHLVRTVAAAQDPTELAELAHSRRRVEYRPQADGTAVLSLIGPSAELDALHRRLYAVARAVRRSELGAFGQQVPPGARVIDERSLDQLCFDMLSSYLPHVSVQAVLPIEPGTSADAAASRGSRPTAAAEDARAQHTGSHPQRDSGSFGNLQCVPGSGNGDTNRGHPAPSAGAAQAVRPPSQVDGHGGGPAGSEVTGSHTQDDHEQGVRTHSGSPRAPGSIVCRHDGSCLHRACGPGIAKGAGRGADEGETSDRHSAMIGENRPGVPWQGRSVPTVRARDELDRPDRSDRPGRPDRSHRPNGTGVPDGAGGTFGADEPDGPGWPGGSNGPVGLDGSTVGGQAGQLVTLTLTCPTNTQWLRAQARVALTVPALTALGLSELPGELADGALVPADAVRRIAGGLDSVVRILTDPVDGHVLDAAARTYAIPAPMRTAIEAKWQHCTAPGCSRRSGSCELDHRVPFDHENPGSGGRTDFENLHPLCKRHHQMKTDGRLVPTRTAEGMLAWSLNGGISAVTEVSGNPVSAQHASEFTALLTALAESSGTVGEGADGRVGAECERDAAAGHDVRLGSTGPLRSTGQPRSVGHLGGGSDRGGSGRSGGSGHPGSADTPHVEPPPF